MFTLSIVTPERRYYEGQVRTLVVPGTEGYLGILSNHAPLITALQNGYIELRDADDMLQIMAVSGGFLEVSENRATILADTVEASDEIDLERAEKAIERAKKALKEFATGGGEVDLQQAREALERAQNRVRVYHETH
jgi:F-type H+-transporting ATPase subunit epsilon